MTDNDDFPTESIDMAMLYRLTNQHQHAVDLLRSLLNPAAPDHWAWELLYRTLVDADLIDQAEAHLDQWLEASPGNAVATHLLAAFKALPTPERAPTTYVANSYATAAANYDRFLQVQQYQAPAVFLQLLTNSLGEATSYRQLADNRLVVELGCGTGAMGAVLRSFADKLIGVDLAPEMLAYAHKTQQYDQLVCADLIDYLQDSPDSIDVIVAAESFNYFGNLSQLIPRCFNALKPDGWLVFSLQEGPLAEDGYYMLPKGSFMHSPQYIIEQLGEAGLAGGNIRRVVMRTSQPHSSFALLIAVQRPRVN